MTSIRNTHETAHEFTARMKGQSVVAVEAIARNVSTDNFKTWKPVTIKAGERVEVVSMINAGFRGMELSVRKADGTLVSGITETAFAR
jgi:predicted DNA-binding antitoxin AbrB/MazE fold protein